MKNYIVILNHRYITVLIGLACVVGATNAQTVPELILFQGKVSDTTNGGAVATGDYNLTVRLWTEEGSNVWSEVHTEVPVVEGWVNMVLGGLSNGLAEALSLGALQVDVVDDGISSERMEFLSLPYAMHAESTHLVQGHEILPSIKILKRIMDLESPDSDFVPIPSGTNSGIDPEVGSYSLTVSNFYMERFEVSLGLWQEVSNWAVTNGYAFQYSGSGITTNHPVYEITWYDIVKWCNARSEMDDRGPCYYTDSTHFNLYKTGNIYLEDSWVDWNTNGYRLPTIVEREYAARGGLTSRRFPWGDTINHDQANYRANSSAYSYDTSPYYTWTSHPDYAWLCPVDKFPPNAYGLYNISSNIEEWCWDRDPIGTTYRFIGESSGSDAEACSVSKFFSLPASETDAATGFRTVHNE